MRARLVEHSRPDGVEQRCAASPSRCPSRSAGILEDRLDGGSLHDAFERLGRIPTQAQARVSARRATDIERRLLGLDPDGVVLSERRTIDDQDGDPDRAHRDAVRRRALRVRGRAPARRRRGGVVSPSRRATSVSISVARTSRSRCGTLERSDAADAEPRLAREHDRSRRMPSAAQTASPTRWSRLGRARWPARPGRDGGVGIPVSSTGRPGRIVLFPNFPGPWVDYPLRDRLGDGLGYPSRSSTMLAPIPSPRHGWAPARRLDDRDADARHGHRWRSGHRWQAPSSARRDAGEIGHQTVRRTAAVAAAATRAAPRRTRRPGR